MTKLWASEDEREAVLAWISRLHDELRFSAGDFWPAYMARAEDGSMVIDVPPTTADVDEALYASWKVVVTEARKMGTIVFDGDPVVCDD